MKRIAILLVILCTVAGILAHRAAAAAGPQRTVLLISFDGWRWDYFDRVPTPNLHALARRGVRARELIPSFPSLTFPNHYTIVTGLYPSHHGIVANDMEDPGFAQPFAMAAATAKDPRWWGGEPIWVTAANHGLHTAAMFWPGNEVPIEGVWPDHWQPFDDKFPNAERVAKVLNWIAMPEEERPSFISLYFSDVDHAGHDFGPDSPQLVSAARELDSRLGDLISGIHRLGADDRVDIVVVSDHGMATIPDGHFVFLDDVIDVGAAHVVGVGALLQVAPRGNVDDVYRRLHGRVPHVAIYRRNEIPEHLHYRDNPRIAPIVGIAEPGWLVTTRARRDKRIADGRPTPRGEHGYDPRVRDVHALFVAAGPGIRAGLVVEPFENVNIYDFLCALLDLTPAPNDGSPDVARRLMISSP